MKGSGLIAFIAKSELLRLTRDRKALFFAVVLPILLYPLLFWGSERLGQVSEERLEAQTTSFVADLRGFPPELAASLRDEVGALEHLLHVHTEGRPGQGARVAARGREGDEEPRDRTREGGDEGRRARCHGDRHGQGVSGT